MTRTSTSTFSSRDWFGFDAKTHTVRRQHEPTQQMATNLVALTVILEEMANRLNLQLQQPPKCEQEPTIDESILVQNDQLPSFKWPLGRIAATYPGICRLSQNRHTMISNRLKTLQKQKTKRIGHQLKFIRSTRNLYFSQSSDDVVESWNVRP